MGDYIGPPRVNPGSKIISRNAPNALAVAVKIMAYQKQNLTVKLVQLGAKYAVIAISLIMIKACAKSHVVLLLQHPLVAYYS